MYQAFSRFSGRFKGHVCGQENGAGDSLGTRLIQYCTDPLMTSCQSTPNSFIQAPHQEDTQQISAHSPLVQGLLTYVLPVEAFVMGIRWKQASNVLSKDQDQYQVTKINGTNFL